MRRIMIGRSWVAALALLGGLAAMGQMPGAEEVIDFRQVMDATCVKVKKDTVMKVVEADGLHLYQFEFEKGPKYPGITFTCPAKEWDLSGYTGMETVVSNLGKDDTIVNVRVDNAESNGKWNNGSDWVKAGATTTIKVAFGKEVNFTHHVEQYFVRPSYALDTAHVAAINVFAAKPKGGGSILIRAIRGVHSSAWEEARTPARVKEVEEEKRATAKGEGAATTRAVEGK